LTPSRSPILPALVVGLLAFAWLNHIHPPFAITDDGIRDQLLARDCTDLGRCHMIGANASVPGFHHGPVWLDLLAGVRVLGGDTTSQRTVVIVLMALSAFTLFVVVWRWLRPSLSVPATVLFLVGLTLDPSPSLLINPSITALPDVITVAGILCYGLSSRFAFLLIAAFALGAAISVHLGAAPLVVSLVTIAGLVQQRALRGMTGAGAIVLATYAITSSAALRANVIALAQPARLAVACVATGLLALLCHRYGPGFRRLGWETRAGIIGALLVVPFALAALWLVAREQHQISLMYLHPVLATTAVCAAALIVLPFEIGARWYRPLRWLPSAAAVALGSMAALLSFMRWPTGATVAEVRGWAPADAAAIAAYATQAGWEYEDVLFRLQSQSCLVLLTGMSIAAPPPRARESPGTSHVGRVLQVVRGAHGELPRLTTPHAMVVLNPRTVAIVREIGSWLQPESLRACRSAAGGATPRCVPAHRKVIDAIGAQRFLFITRAFPEIHSLDVPRPYRATYEIPLVVAESGTRDIAMLDGAPPDCSWQIVRADGVRVETELPARRARLRAESDARGVLVVEKRFGASDCGVGEADMRYPPCMFEAPADDPLLALVTR
jgi:hypothetical protein